MPGIVVLLLKPPHSLALLGESLRWPKPCCAIAGRSLAMLYLAEALLLLATDATHYGFRHHGNPIWCRCCIVVL